MVRGKILPRSGTLKSTCCHSDNSVDIPLVSIGPSGIGGVYQNEKVQ